MAVRGDDLGPVTLTLQAEPSDVPASVRLRRVLKSLLRHYGFRLVEFKGAELQEAQDLPSPDGGLTCQDAAS